MKLDNEMLQDKLQSLEEGPMRYKNNIEDSFYYRVKQNKNWSCCIQFMKVILYIELVLFTGWIGCILLSNYYWDLGPMPSNEISPYEFPNWAEVPNGKDHKFIPNDSPVADNAMITSRSLTTTSTETSRISTESTISDPNKSEEIQHSMTSNFEMPLEQDLNTILALLLRSVKIPFSESREEEISGRQWQDQFSDESHSSKYEKKSVLQVDLDSTTTSNSDEMTVIKSEHLIKFEPRWDKFRVINPSIWDDSDKLDSSRDEEQAELHKDSVPSIFSNSHALLMDTSDDNGNSEELSPPRSFWSDYILGPDYADDDNDDDSPFRLFERRRRQIAGSAESDSKSSSEEATTIASKTKRSTENKASAESGESDSKSSSDEATTIGSANKPSVDNSPGAGNDESDSKSPSDETTIASKAKRSAKNSSSETENQNDDGINDKSNSLESSSSEDNTNGIDSDYKLFGILFDNFNEMSESVLQYVLERCGNLGISCSPEDFQIEEDDTNKTENHRTVRSVTDDTLLFVVNLCADHISTNTQKIDEFAAKIIIGESSDPIVTELRSDFATEMKILITNMSIGPGLFSVITFLHNLQQNGTLSSSQYLSDENVQLLIQRIKDYVASSADMEHQQRLNATGTPSPAVMNEFREIVVDMFNASVVCQILLKHAESNMTTGESGPRVFWRERRAVESTHQEDESVKKWFAPDSDLLEERRARLENVARKVAAGDILSPHLKKFMSAVERVLNSKSTSEIEMVDEKLFDSSLILWMAKHLLSNASLEVQKEGYALARDVFLEIRALYNRQDVWKDFNRVKLSYIAINCTKSLSEIINETITPALIFDTVVKLGTSLNLHYEQLENTNSNDCNNPVVGKFVYLDQEEPEHLGIRHFRHILDAIVKFCFNLQKPCSSVKEIVNAEQITETNAEESARKKRSIDNRSEKLDENVSVQKCFVPDSDLLEERQQRLEKIAKENITVDTHLLHTKRFMDAIEAALNANTTSEIRIDDEELLGMSLILTMAKHLLSNESLEVQKEGYELARDLFLEIRQFVNQDDDWKDSEFENIFNIARNFSDDLNLDKKDNITSEWTFEIIVKLGKSLNMHYEEFEKRNDGDTDSPVLGKFVYRGQEPEPIGVRHFRHICDAIIKFYFSLQKPCSSLKKIAHVTGTGSEVSGRDKRSIDNPMKKIEDESANQWFVPDSELLEERRARLNAMDEVSATGILKSTYTEKFLLAIEAILNANTTSEIQIDSKNLEQMMKLLPVVKCFVSNESLEVQKEGYAIARDIFIESRQMDRQLEVWENITSEKLSYMSNNFSTSMDNGVRNPIVTPALVFDLIVKAATALNLHYEELGNRNDSDPNNRVAAKFVYLDQEEPERLGVRRFRHIFNAFLKFYHNVQTPCSSMDINEYVEPETTETYAEETDRPKRSIDDPTWKLEDDESAKKWFVPDSELLEERRARLNVIDRESATGKFNSTSTEKFLLAIEAILNAKTTSEIRIENEDWQHMMKFLPITKCFVSNESLEAQKEGYAIARDIFLESRQMDSQIEVWQNFSFEKLSHIANNFSDSMDEEVRNQIVTPALVFDIIGKAATALNLHYEESGNRNDSDSNNRVVAKFVYLDQEEPEHLGIRRFRHIFNAFLKFYYNVQNPCSSVHKNGTMEQQITESTAEEIDRPKRSIDNPTEKLERESANEWFVPDSELLEERRERLNVINKEIATGSLHSTMTEMFLRAIETVLNANTTSETWIDNEEVRLMLLLQMDKCFLSNASLEVQKEGYALVRDAFLELRQMENQQEVWKDFGIDKLLHIMNIFSNTLRAIRNETVTPDLVFNTIIKLAIPLNLHYEELENKTDNDSNNPAAGKFVYFDGVVPEHLGIRHIRHIFNAYLKFYYNIQKPCSSSKENANVEPLVTENNVEVSGREKRSIDNAIEKSEEDESAKKWFVPDSELLEERRARLNAIDKEKASGKFNSAYTETVLLAAEAIFNANTTSEIQIHDYELRKMFQPIAECFLSNESLEAQKEGYAIALDMFLESRQLEKRLEVWTDFPDAKFTKIINNVSESVGDIRNQTITPALILDFIIKAGRAMNLHYEELGNRNDSDSNNRILAKFVYLDQEEPEHLGMRHFRHIFNAFLKFYYNVQTLCSSVDLNENVEPEITESYAEVTDRPRRSIDNPTWKLSNSVMDVDDIQLMKNEETPDLESRMENFFDKMDGLAAHIDRLHKRYMNLNELNDDYVSLEFPVDSPLIDDDNL